MKLLLELNMRASALKLQQLILDNKWLERVHVKLSEEGNSFKLHVTHPLYINAIVTLDSSGFTPDYDGPWGTSPENAFNQMFPYIIGLKICSDAFSNKTAGITDYLVDPTGGTDDLTIRFERDTNDHYSQMDNGFTFEWNIKKQAFTLKDANGNYEFGDHPFTTAKQMTSLMTD